MGTKPVETPMDPSVKLCVDRFELLPNSGSYQTLVGKLNCLTIMHLDIFFAVSVISQFVYFSLDSHGGSLEHCAVS